MNIRHYNHNQDYSRVDDFLVEIYQPGDTFGNWLQPRWEYMHYNQTDEPDPTKIGIFEDDGKIVGVVNMEADKKTAYLQVRPGYESIKPDMFDYAEANFQGLSQSTGNQIRVLYISEFDEDFTELAKVRGYEIWPDFAEENSRCLLDKPVPEGKLPGGFRLHSLADELDYRKINRVLWRGFNHPGPPPEEHVQSRKDMLLAPNFRKELTIVAVAPDGNYVSYCGMWFVPANRVAYVEPVATDPDYRRMGLGKAAVLESVRRVAALGADVAWVGSGLEFYSAIGFEKMFTFFPWVKVLD